MRAEHELGGCRELCVAGRDDFLEEIIPEGDTGDQRDDEDDGNDRADDDGTCAVGAGVRRGGAAHALGRPGSHTDLLWPGLLIAATRVALLRVLLVASLLLTLLRALLRVLLVASLLLALLWVLLLALLVASLLLAVLWVLLVSTLLLTLLRVLLVAGLLLTLLRALLVAGLLLTLLRALLRVLLVSTLLLALLRVLLVSTLLLALLVSALLRVLLVCALLLALQVAALLVSARVVSTHRRTLIGLAIVGRELGAHGGLPVGESSLRDRSVSYQALGLGHDDRLPDPASSAFSSPGHPPRDHRRRLRRVRNRPLFQ